ncbi:MAG TPA: DUF3658 domain-containing protein, partial [Phnomibacter sp.]|nr:DUF3658 domain-containing protein [Phnomibacter sp.]
NWWRTILDSSGEGNTDTLMDMVDDKKTLLDITRRLDEDAEEKIWIWAAQNKHDVCGYYWLVSQLSAYSGRVFILYLNNLPFFNDKGGIFYPQWLSEIPPREYLKAKKLARPVTPSEFEVDTDEWAKICEAGKMVRLLEGGKKLIQQDEDFYDAAIAKYVHGDLSRASRIVNQFLTKEKETTGDLFVIWRLKQMVGTKGYEIKGDINKTVRDFDLRDPAKPSLKKKAESGEGEDVAG